ncbi:DUF4157 domain-containing protein [Methylomonas sp. ZR1]|uniref:eCIS core domain-containing protein n=1 Tax=Methylomonas sp. ZR1 TaxID=1797072 RepID=UPI0014915701|nr:DUF4157 domain-containing protein [Methylomonas sp. ZR1]NOV32400.1 DUF4157 domain-containing protein [Methylomonas sp. ZR1]
MATLASKLRKKSPLRKTSAPPKPNEEKKQRKPAYLQRKMAVSQPHDPEEKEADQVAQEVSRAKKTDEQPGVKEDKEMISSKPVPSAQRLLRRLNRAAANAAKPEEEQKPVLRAKKPDDENKNPVAKRSVETEDKKEDQLMRLSRKAKEEETPKAARLFRKAAGPEKTDEQQTTAARLLRKSKLADEEQTVAQTRLHRAAAEQAEQPEDTESAASANTVEQSVEARIEESRGKGAPLPENIRREMEQQLGADFAGVTIHNDAEAADLCKQLNARAFTVGNDVYFAPGEFAPEADAGRELLAHELSHVVQQSGGVQRVMRAPPAAPAAAPAAGGAKSAGKGTLKGGELHVPLLTLPQKPGMQEKFSAKYGGLTNWKLPQADERTNQIDDWKKQIKPSSGSWDLKPYLGSDNTLPDTSGASTQYALKLKAGGGGQGYLIGSESDIREQAILPWWNSQGAPHLFDVDHILELQLGGDADKLENFQLLDASANRSSGSKIKNAIDKAIRAAIPPEVEGGGDLPENLSKPLPGRGKAAPGAAPAPAANAAATTPAPAAVGGAAPATAAKDPASAALDAIKTSYQDKLIFDEVKFEGTVGGNPGICWQADRVTKMEHMKPLEKATKSNAPDLFANDKLRLLPRPGAGVMFVSALKGDPGSETFDAGSWGGMSVVGGTFNRTAGSGTVTLTMPKTKKVDAQNTTLNFVSSGAPTLCHIPPGQVADAYRNAFKAKTLSPIALNNADMDASANIVGGGVLTIDGIPLLAGTTVDVALVGGDLVFSKTFSTDEFDMKGPIQLDSSSLTLSAGAATPIAAAGLVEFHIGELAKGSLEGSATAGGFAMAGQLEFDKQLFTGAGRIDYDSAKGIKASGTLGLKPGALKGIKKASFTLAYDDAKKAIDFAGDAEVSVPGFKGAKLSAHADDTGNISLGGEATLSDTIPRIKAGKLNIAADRKGDVWSLGGGGELEPDLSGLDASAKIKLDYKDGLLNGKLTANYKRSMLAGNIDLNAKAVVGDGGGEAEPINVWGSGTVDVTAAPWLKATVGLTLDEKGEITVSGELGLPSSLEIFPRKEINKSLFAVATQVPIVPGIVAEVGGNLSATAGIGPGSLDQLKIGLTYNPDHEQDTKITGDAHLKVPADAGLRLAVRAGIGLGITGASATGGLEIGGKLGIEGAAEAGVHVDWTPATGLDLTAKLSVSAQPSFTFDISGYVAVTALGFSVYDQRWQLASYQFGSDYKFGISLPVHYHEGQPFDVSLDDVQFEVPDISPGDILSGLIARIA